jgi:hypothetical protein
LTGYSEQACQRALGGKRNMVSPALKEIKSACKQHSICAIVGTAIRTKAKQIENVAVVID